jgi:hydrogenase maturation protease
MNVVVAGMGNVLRGDDGFGVAVAQRLEAADPPSGVRVLELGIGGIHLVQELLEPTDALVIVDAVDLGRPPGAVTVIRPHVQDVAALSLKERHDALADMHYATPERALMLAGALNILPENVWLVGCQPRDADGLREGLSPEVAAALEPAIAEVRRLLAVLGVEWAPP